jgi:hypothetical protein
MTSPTQRTLKWLRDDGYLATVTEHYNAFTHRRIDLLGFGDILAIQPGVTLLVQCTTTSNMAARVTKIRGECADNARAWLAAGNKIQVVGWSLRGERGKRKTWQAKIVEITEV